jgi:hypothetical protein
MNIRHEVTENHAVMYGVASILMIDGVTEVSNMILLRIYRYSGSEITASFVDRYK